MTNKCERCRELPPKNLQKQGVESHEPCPWCVKKLAPRASKRPFRRDKK